MDLTVAKLMRRRRWRKPGLVEVSVSPHCEHGCLEVAIGSESVWHIETLKSFTAKANDWQALHVCNEPEACENDCYE